MDEMFRKKLGRNLVRKFSMEKGIKRRQISCYFKVKNPVLENEMSITHPKNVRFKCIKCGICCGDTPEKERNILLLKKEAQRISTLTKRQIGDFADELTNKEPYAYEMKKTTKGGKCLFLQHNKCTIYHARPLICRFYPFGLETDQNMKRFFYTKECLGIGKGRIVEERDFNELLNLANSRIATAGSVDFCDYKYG